MDYYLYSHSNADGIFYIGKGCGDRVKHNFLSNRSSEGHEASKNGYLTKIEATGTEECILSAEKMYIKLLIEQGVNLVNKIHNPNFHISDEHCKKISDANLGKTLSNKTKKKISDSRLGIKFSDETKRKMSDAQSGKNNNMFGKKNHGAIYGTNKRWQHFRLAKANNYRRTL